jgi:hypothetical protein
VVLGLGPAGTPGVGGIAGVPGASPIPRTPATVLTPSGQVIGTGTLTFFSDPLASARAQSASLINVAGQSALDPSYATQGAVKNAAYQGAVDALGAVSSLPPAGLGVPATFTEPGALPAGTSPASGVPATPVTLSLPPNLGAGLEGPGITAKNILLSGDMITNMGSLMASNDLAITAGTFLDAAPIVPLTGDGFTGGLTGTALGSGGLMQAANLSISAVNGIDIIGGTLNATSDLTLASLGDIDVLAAVTDQAKTSGGEVVTTSRQVTNHGSELTAGQALAITSDLGSVTVEASRLDAARASLSAGEQVRLLAGTDTATGC